MVAEIVADMAEANEPQPDQSAVMASASESAAAN